MIFACWVIFQGILRSKFTFSKKNSGTPSGCQTVWIQIRPTLGKSCWAWPGSKLFANCYQQTTQVGKVLKYLSNKFWDFFIGLVKQKKISIILSISLNMCFWCSKELSHWDGSFEYPQYMFWLRNKKNNFQLRTLIWRPVLSWFPRKYGLTFHELSSLIIFSCNKIWKCFLLKNFGIALRVIILLKMNEWWSAFYQSLSIYVFYI